MALLDPFALFAAWFAEAKEREPDANAMTLATVGADGRPSARIVLLKDFDAAGFVTYTNLESRKGREALAHPAVALCFHWKSLKRQVRVEGDAARVPDAEADAYFATRPRLSQIGAWASQQSRPLDARETLERRVREFEAKYPTTVPRPPHWSGLRITPRAIELWSDRPFRLHERQLFTRASPSEPWQVQTLYP